MLFREALARGDPGLRWDVPGDLHTLREDAGHLVLRDPARGVTWRARRLPWPYALGPGLDEALRADVEADARLLFEAARQPGDATPRTADPAWSPLVELERVQLPGGWGARLVRREAYQAGRELLWGSLLVPVRGGVVEVGAGAGANETGFRESMEMAKRMVGRRPPDGPGAGVGEPIPPQAEFDDPALDRFYPTHPLSRVRAALQRLLGEGGPVVTAPPPALPEGEVHAEAAGCFLRLPPRYGFVPRVVMPLAPTLASYVKPGLPDAPVRMIDVWRHPERITGPEPARALHTLASRSTAAWAEEGVANLRHQSEILEGAQVRTVALFDVQDGARISVMRWRVDPDGTVFRVAAAAPTGEAELRAQADAVMASLRRG